MESASRQTWPLTTKVDTIYLEYSTQILSIVICRVVLLAQIHKVRH